MSRIRYEWELRGLLTEWLSIDREVSVGGIVFKPLTKDGIEYIQFVVSLSTTDRSRHVAMRKCMNKLEGLVRTWSFCRGTPMKISEKELLLTNENALEESGVVREQTIGFGANVILKKTAKSDELTEVMRLKERIHQHSRKKGLLKCIDWCVRSIEQEDPFDKFITLWVGFNIIYNLYDAYRNPSSHRDEFNDHRKAIQIKEIVNGSNLVQIFKTKFKIIDLLNQYTISHEKTDGLIVHYNVELERYYNTNDLRNAFEMLLECLYKIRCSLRWCF